MRAADYARLFLLAALWGGAFIFLRVAAPVLGPVWTSELRVLLGGLALLAWFRATGFDPGLRRHARVYLLLGGVMIALPFTLYAFASMHAPASLLSIVNSTAPIFGMAWSAALGDERITRRKGAGLVLGVAGVAVGNQLAAALVLLPLLPLMPPLAAPSTLVIANMLALALLASGVAFLLYFRLIADVGATRALTVTYLIPLFGILWGWLFLGEALPASALAGGVLILAGTVLVTRS